MSSRAVGLFAGVVMLMAIGAGKAWGQPDSLWWKTYGGRAGDACNSLIQTTDGGFAMAGLTASFRVGNDTDAWLLKTDAAGDSLWARAYDRGGFDLATSVVQTTDGGFAIACSQMPDPSDFSLIRTDEFGNVLWSFSYDRAYFDVCKSLIQTSDGGFALAGSTGPSDYFDANRDFWLVRTNDAGEVVWSRSYGTPAVEDCYSVIQTNDGGFVMVGETRPLETYRSDFWIVKADVNGDSLWSRMSGVEGGDWSRDVVQTSDGRLAIGGHGGTFTKSGMQLAVMNANGDSLWSRVYGGGNGSWDNCSSLIQTIDGGFSLAGYSGSYGEGGGFWLMQTSPNGDSLWSRGFPVGPAVCNSHIQMPDGRFVLAGDLYRHNINEHDFLLVETGTDPLGLTDHPIFAVSSGFAASSFPSPFNSSLSISYSSPTNAPLLISLVDLNGRTLEQNWLPGTSFSKGVATIGTTALPSGNYFVIVGGKDGAVMPVRCLK